MATILDLIREAHPEWRTGEDMLKSIVATLTDREFEVLCSKYLADAELLAHLKKLRADMARS